MLLMIDNYDSFTYNLVQYFGELGQVVKVYRNDEISIDEARELNPEYLVISPGPCAPKQDLPILGVCLGHQAIGEAFGGKIIKSPKPMHGKLSKIDHDSNFLFSEIENNFLVTRYHSLTIDPDSLPNEIIVNAKSEDGVIMGIQHRELNISGVQFHPESIKTENGKKILLNFLNSK